MRFTKMHGAGNDYIYVDCFAQPVPHDIPELARRISDRRFGVGADGLILICPSERADAEMRMFNADGSYGRNVRQRHSLRRQVCLRSRHSAPRYAEDRIGGARAVTRFAATRTAKLTHVRVDMGEPILIPAEIPTTLRSADGPEQPAVECAARCWRQASFGSRACRWAIRIASCSSTRRPTNGCSASDRKSKSIRISRNA